ncbi:MAG TPA: DUF4081 domain-containing protein [Myxococcaceae bacterium]|nr:DUF4081 domain-containing protein [Myxococcaceae bacterium]
MTSTVEPLGPRDLTALRALLTRDTPHNLYLLGVLEEFGVVPRSTRAPFTFYGRFSAKRDLTAAVFVGGQGGLVVPSSSDSELIAPIAEHLSGQVRLRAAMGDKGGVDALVRLLCPDRPKYSHGERLFSVSADDLGPFTNPTLRLASEAELPELVPLAAAFVRETRERDPLKEDPEGFQARVHQRVRLKRTYVLEVGGRLVFKLDVGCRSQYGAELEGLYTVPDERGKGHAILSLGQISRHLLSSLPRLALRVDDRMTKLAGMARKVGYVPGKAQRRVVAEP